MAISPEQIPSPSTKFAATGPAAPAAPTIVAPANQERRPWTPRWWHIVALLLLVTIARLVYLAFFCPYSLVEDEAFYWEWSRRLELSYYTKGPGIAWTIAGTCRLLGDTELGVRAASPVFAGATALVLAMLAHRVTGSMRAAWFACVGFLVVPLFQVLGLLMTIDGPYAFCWSLAALLTWIGVRERKPKALALMGLIIGVGFLFKYTILLLIPGIALAWFNARKDLSRETGTNSRAPMALGVLGAAALFLVGIAPVIIWNVREGWPTIAHLLGHLGVAGGDTQVTQTANSFHYDPRWTLSFLGTQIGLIGPLLIVMIAGVVRARRLDRDDPVRVATMFCFNLGLPLLAFYFLISFLAEPEGNWSLAAYLTWFVPAAFAADRGLVEWKAKVLAWRALPEPRPRAGVVVRRPETLTQAMWYASVGLGVATAIAVPMLVPLAHLTEAARKSPALSKVVPSWAYIPVGRFTGAKQIGAHVDRLATEIRASEGEYPFILAMHYGRAAQLAFYMPNRPPVYCASSLVGGRKTQYDYWPDTNLRVQSHLLDRHAVIVGGFDPKVWEPHFVRLEWIGKLDGEGKRNRPAYKAYGFKGFDGLPPRRNITPGDERRDR